MASHIIWTPCKDYKEETCENYPIDCKRCKRRHDYTPLLKEPHADFYKPKNTLSK